MAFDDRANNFFKPADHDSALAILIEVKEHAPKSEGYQGKITDAVIADVTVFRTEADLAEGGRPRSFPKARIDAALLYKELIENVGVGNETVRKLARWEKSRNADNQKPWIWRYVDAGTREQVIDWYERREAAVAALAGDDDVPDFLK